MALREPPSAWRISFCHERPTCSLPYFQEGKGGRKEAPRGLVKPSCLYPMEKTLAEILVRSCTSAPVQYNRRAASRVYPKRAISAVYVDAAPQKYLNSFVCLLSIRLLAELVNKLPIHACRCPLTCFEGATMKHPPHPQLRRSDTSNDNQDVAYVYPFAAQSLLLGGFKSLLILLLFLIQFFSY